MSKWILVMVLGWTVSAFALDSVDTILGQVYGTVSTACSQDTDLDTATNNRVTLSAGRRYAVYCHDGAGNGIACECLQGGASVDASAAVGIILFAGEKMIIKTTIASSYISCVPYVDNQKMDACPLN